MKIIMTIFIVILLVDFVIRKIYLIILEKEQKQLDELFRNFIEDSNRVEEKIIEKNEKNKKVDDIKLHN